MIKLLNKLAIAALLLGGVQALHAAPQSVYANNLPLTAAELTETSVLVSSLSNVGAVLSTATATRIAFDIQVTTCPVAAPKVWYSFDITGVSTITATATQVIDTYQNNGSSSAWTLSALRYVQQPNGVVHQGPVYMRAEQTGCYVNVREWTTSSPLFQ